MAASTRNGRPDFLRNAWTEIIGIGSRTIIVDDIYFASIRFSPEYENAIEAKQVAQQQVETQKQVLAQREIEAQQKVATAKGEAESIQVVAQGQAKANDALSRSISPILVQYKGIEKWNGILPQVSGGAVPFVDVGKMGGLSGGTERLNR